jgi:hypothetical protein
MAGSERSEARNFEIEVRGQYYAAHTATGVATIKQYTANFVLPSQEAALSIICKYLLDPYLRTHYEDYAKFRTHKITNVKVNGRAPNGAVLQMAFADMGIADLADFCILKHIFIDPYQHKDLEKVRGDIQQIWESRIAQQKADSNSGVKREKEMADALLKMNKLPLSGAYPEINVNEQKIMSAAKAGDKANTDREESPLEPADATPDLFA